MATTSEQEKFDAVFPQIVAELTKETHTETDNAYSRFKELLQYTVPHGKKYRGMTVITSYKRLVPKANEEDLQIARILGWCVELLQAYFLVSDDIMDRSTTRRGKPCWYKKDDVGLMAINDSSFLEISIYSLLKLHIRSKPYYEAVTELFQDVTLQTVVGECLDLISAPPQGHVDFKRFSMDRYSAIVKYKSGFYTFYLPVALAMYMAGINDEESHCEAKKILLKMGHFFQAQDDFLDCYGDPDVIGKVGTDIQVNKCGWLAVRALELASAEQRDRLKECYGRPCEVSESKVKDIYEELDLETIFYKYEEDTYQELMVLIAKSACKVPKQVFTDLADKIFKRRH